MSCKYIVLKFGSSVLQNSSDTSTASHEIYRYVRDGYKVLAVVSAIGDETDALLKKVHDLYPNPSGVSKAFLLSTAEQQSAAFLNLKLEEIGIPSRPLDPREINFLAAGHVEDAIPINVNTGKLILLFETHDVLVLPGFYAAHDESGIALLGRGGSDFSAIFLASQIGVGCRVRLLKDVDGLYERDPSLEGPEPKRYSKVSWDQAIRVAGELVQEKAIEFAKERVQQIEVARCNDFKETLIGTEGPVYDKTPQKSLPLKVGLLGLGTVGLETYKYLKVEENRFEVVGIAVRDLSKYKNFGIKKGLLKSNIDDILNKKPDIIIEVMGGLTFTLKILSKALKAGISIVSANKDLFSKYGDELREIANKGGGKISYSAAVGGSVPVLETIEKNSKGNSIKSLEGVVNGTTNFIIGLLEEGIPFDMALKKAQDKGFAEANPDNDILGWDAIFKLSLCAEAAFGGKPKSEDIYREGITKLTSHKLQELGIEGKTIRHVAKCWIEDGKINTSVNPETLDKTAFLSGATLEKNHVIITKSDGKKIFLKGSGAGAVPTATSVFADLLSFYRAELRERNEKLRGNDYSEDIKNQRNIFENE